MSFDTGRADPGEPMDVDALDEGNPGGKTRSSLRGFLLLMCTGMVVRFRLAYRCVHYLLRCKSAYSLCCHLVPHRVTSGPLIATNINLSFDLNRVLVMDVVVT
jgi:hypothetical protein